MARRAQFRDDRGGALLELGLVLPAFLLLMIGVADFGRLAYFSIEASNAARAGADYGAQSTAYSINTSGIQSAAANDAPNLTSVTTMTVTSNPVCQCDNAGVFTTIGTTTSACASAVASCASPKRVINYVEVDTSAPVSTILQYPGTSSSFTLRGRAIMRIQ